MNRKRIITLVLALVFAGIAVVSVHAATCGACQGRGWIVHSACRGTGNGTSYV
jgi:hypothetical protein